MATEKIVSLHGPHPIQAQVKASPAKRKVLVIGRRSGKTTVLSDIAVEKALAGRRVLEAAPTQEQTEAFWEYCCTALAEPIASGHVYRNETRRILRLPNGGRIRCKTAWDADTLRGDYADLLILDEYAQMDPNTWTEVGAPMLLDNDGDAIFAFTPKRKNHAYQLYLRARQDMTGRWEAWHGTSYDNPYLSKEALAAITEDMPEGSDAYRQEIMAEFLESTGQVFRNLDAVLIAPTGATLADHKGHDFVVGVDWGKHTDFTSISVLCARCKTEVALHRFNKIDYIYQAERLKGICKDWGDARVLAESNAMGEPILERLAQEGLYITGFQTTATTKPPLIESLALAFERAEVKLLPDAIGRMELEAYERKVSATLARSSYSAPEGVHDDTVISRALSWWGAQDSGPLLLWDRGE